MAAPHGTLPIASGVPVDDAAESALTKATVGALTKPTVGALTKPPEASLTKPRRERLGADEGSASPSASEGSSSSGAGGGGVGKRPAASGCGGGDVSVSVSVSGSGSTSKGGSGSGSGGLAMQPKLGPTTPVLPSSTSTTQARPNDGVLASRIEVRAPRCLRIACPPLEITPCRLPSPSLPRHPVPPALPFPSPRASCPPLPHQSVLTWHLIGR